jgi:hypothetical protein
MSRYRPIFRRRRQPLRTLLRATFFTAVAFGLLAALG